MKRVHAIDIELLDDICDSAKSCYPQEFLCMLRAEDGVINEMVLLPGTVNGDEHSFLNLWMAPPDFLMVGSIHSHPGYSNEPSDADIDFFSHYGGVHIIICQPYDHKSWKAYDSKGRIVPIEIVSL